MQFHFTAKRKRDAHIRANITTRDPVPHETLEISDFKAFIEDPQHLVIAADKYGDEFDVVVQVTSSGTLEFKFYPREPKNKADHLKNLKLRQKQELEALEAKHEKEVEEEEERRKSNLETAKRLEKETKEREEREAAAAKTTVNP